MKRRDFEPKTRGGWSGGPVPSGSNWPLAIACLLVGFGAVALMVWISQ
jgi:hypothetical protein